MFIFGSLMEMEHLLKSRGYWPVSNSWSFALCLQAMEGRATGGGDVEFRQRANRRGRAYLCQRCLTEKGHRYINTKIRMENHILLSHLKTSQIPYLCTLCYYKCLSSKDLIQHYQSKKHKETVAREGITDCTPYLIKNGSTYTFGPNDYTILEQEESRATFSRRAAAANESKRALPPEIQKCIDSGYFDSGEGKGSVQEEIVTGKGLNIEAQPTGLFMDLQDAFDANFTVAKGTFDLVDSMVSVNSVNIASEAGVQSGVMESDNSKRKGETEDIVVSAKVQRVDDSRTVIDMDKINQGTLVACLSRLVEATERNTRTLERIENLLVDNTVVTSKNADSTTRLRWAIDWYEKNETEREESRIEYDRKVSEERRAEMGRWRKQAERWAETGRRQAEDKKDECDEKDSRDSWRYERRDGKENRPTMKSVVLKTNNWRDEERTDED